MGSNAAIDVAISLILMYLVLSLIVTVLNEIIATAVDLRAANLQAALTALIDDPALRTQFYDHGLIAGANDAAKARKGFIFRFVDWLYRLIARSGPSDGSHVSYVSGQVFARALLGSVDAAKSLPTYQDIEAAIKNLPDTNVRDALLAQLATANGDLQLLHANVAAWFDNAMDRVSGVYKRHLKQLSLLVGMTLVLVVNADTLKVSKSLWNDAALRATMVETAGGLVNSGPPQGDAASNTTAAAAGNTAGQAVPAPRLSYDVRVREAVQRIRTEEQQLRPLPLGWNWSSAPQWPWHWSLAWPVLAKIVGLFLTAIAISLGAPFWFDLLSMFMQIRGTGDKPEKTSTT